MMGRPTAPWSGLWLRSMLYAPGSSARLLDRVFDAGADAVILDLEDAVAMEAKPVARELVRESLERRRDDAGPPVFVRVNAVASGLLELDLEAIVHPRLMGVKLAKADAPTDVERCDALLRSLELARGIPEGRIAIMPTIESAAGVESVSAIVRAASRIWCASFGAEDFAVDTGGVSSAGASESLYARSRIVVASRAAGIAPPFDSAYPHLDRPAGLAANARASRRLGFQGKSVIHPKQIPVVHRVYAPTEAETSWARRVTEAFAAAEAEGKAAFVLDGSLIDYAMLRRAERILALSSSDAAAADPV